jgi:ribosome-associated protein
VTRARAPLRISDELSIPLAELTYRASRAGGPGGQHVNTSATRVELSFDVSASPSLSAAQRARILERLANRIDSAGVLRLVSGTRRSQLRNREDVTARFARLLAAALKERTPRRRTTVPRAASEARLKSKRTRSEVKRQRKPVTPEE